ncbi:DNA repair protein RadA [Paraburkholderia sp. UCT31]|uniref:DNA repair protein RadA n=1 Tax=Paraburkholderia sp. UCT31 TaxID=2615209 RepID=UPI001655B913|nr:DNA repair protein RadA [Paraburkholderia sp. UCT31]MBC8738525.1 DNA repair protein RadA [Paraburkholderia sp. UCT31]
MAKQKTGYFCTECGGQTSKWAGQCPHCNEWNCLQEGMVDTSGPSKYSSWAGESTPAIDLNLVEGEDVARSPSGVDELDRVLGGGIVRGAVILIGGDPGIGKSTLLLQALASISRHDMALYASGEESQQQIKLRADRMGVGDCQIKLVAETQIERVLQQVEQYKPRVAVLDSIQTMFSSKYESAPGSVTQVRECTAELTRYAKSRGTTFFLVGHVTKEGNLAGPRVLEHIVDTVLYFEGEPGSSYRMLRAIKNRFGAVNELGVFAMTETGLSGVSNPSSMFLTQHDVPVSGCSVCSSLEGNRPFMVEVQALVEDTTSPSPRRYASGFDLNRLQMLIAVLNKHAPTQSFEQNVYLKVVGGVRLTEPASDLAALLSVHSSFRNRPLPTGLVLAGEVGLAGEIRAIPDVETRLREAAKLGFKLAIVPAANKLAKPVPGIDVRHVARLDKALDLVSELG